MTTKEDIKRIFLRTSSDFDDYLRSTGIDPGQGTVHEWVDGNYSIKDESRFEEFYKKVRYEKTLAEWHSDPKKRRWYRCFILDQILMTLRSLSVMDYGSGIGTDAITLRALGYTVNCWDINEPCNKFFLWRQENSYGMSIPIEMASADTLLMYDVIEHLPSPYDFLDRLLIQYRYKSVIMTQAFGIHRDDPYHTEYNMSGIIEVLRRHGFKKIRVRGTAFPPYVFVHESDPASNIETLRVGAQELVRNASNQEGGHNG